MKGPTGVKGEPHRACGVEHGQDAVERTQHGAVAGILDRDGKAWEQVVNRSKALAQNVDVLRVRCHASPRMRDVHLHGMPLFEEFDDLHELAEGNASVRRARVRQRRPASRGCIAKHVEVKAHRSGVKNLDEVGIEEGAQAQLVHVGIEIQLDDLEFETDGDVDDLPQLS